MSSNTTEARRRHGALAWFTILAFLGPLTWLAAGCQKGPADESDTGDRPPVLVQTVTVAVTQIPRTLSAVGTLESPQDTELPAEVAGTVVFLDIPEGKEVAQGHLLARIDERQPKAAMSVAKARYRNAKDTLERLRALREATLISQQEFDDATAELEAAEGELEEARTTLTKTVIRAPFAGVLGLRHVSLGTYLDPGNPVVRLTQTKPLHLVFTLPQDDVSQVATGQTVRAVVGTCVERFAGRVAVIEPSVDPSTRSVRVRAVVPNKSGRLRPGMSASIRLEVANISDAMLVPQEAVVRQGTKKLVYAVGSDGLVSPKEVSLGAFFAAQVEVTAGLAPGEVVVASGHQKLWPGAKVVAQPYEPIPNPNLLLGSARNGPSECDF